MTRKLPPHIYQQTYKTRAGYKETRYYIRLTDSKGKRRVFPGGPKLQKAREIRDKLLGQAAEGFDFERAKQPGPQLFPWVEKFLSLKKAKASYDKDIRSTGRLKEYFGDCQLDEIVASRIQAYREERNGEGLKDSTINRELACLRSILRLAHQDGVLSRMPFILFQAEHNERTRTATEGEYAKILKGLKGEVRDVVEILWEMGFRVSEVLDIRAGDLDVRRGMIDTARIRLKGGLKRPLPWSERAGGILRARARNRKVGDSLFNVTRYQVSWDFRAVCKAQGIMGLWLHDLRSTFATRKLRDGWDRELIKQFTGHRSDYAFRRYSRPTLDDLRRFIGQDGDAMAIRKPDVN